MDILVRSAAGVLGLLLIGMVSAPAALAYQVNVESGDVESSAITEADAVWACSPGSISAVTSGAWNEPPCGEGTASRLAVAEFEAATPVFCIEAEVGQWCPASTFGWSWIVDDEDDAQNVNVSVTIPGISDLSLSDVSLLAGAAVLLWALSWVLRQILNQIGRSF